MNCSKRKDHLIESPKKLQFFTQRRTLLETFEKRSELVERTNVKNLRLLERVLDECEMLGAKLEDKKFKYSAEICAFHRRIARILCCCLKRYEKFNDDIKDLSVFEKGELFNAKAISLSTLLSDSF